MPDRAEATELHTRLVNYALHIDDARAYWERRSSENGVTARKAFDEFWFGARSLRRTNLIIGNMRARFDAFPRSLSVLGDWKGMAPETRRLICHWHLQLADPLYREFTGSLLPDRRDEGREQVTRDWLARWVSEKGEGRWGTATCLKFASKLLSAALSAGLVAERRDPRRIVIPRVPDDALEYLLYLLRDVRFDGTLLQNPFLRSVGLEGRDLERRLGGLPGLNFRRQGDLVDFGWRYRGLEEWGRTATGDTSTARAGRVG